MVNGGKVLRTTVQGSDMGLLVLCASGFKYVTVSADGTHFEETTESPVVDMFFRVDSKPYIDLDVYASVQLDTPMHGDVFTLLLMRLLLEAVLFRATDLTAQSLAILDKACVFGVLDAQEIFNGIRRKLIELFGQKNASCFVSFPRTVMQGNDGLLGSDPSYVRFAELFSKMRNDECLGYNDLGFIFQYANGLARGVKPGVSLQYGFLEEFFMFPPVSPLAFSTSLDATGVGKLVGMPFSLSEVCSFGDESITPLVTVIGDGYTFDFCVSISMVDYEAFKLSFTPAEPAAAMNPEPDQEAESDQEPAEETMEEEDA